MKLPGEAIYRNDGFWIVIWQSYSDWKSSMPFETKKDAEIHADRRLSVNDYNKHIEVRFIPLPDAARPDRNEPPGRPKPV